MPHRAAVTAQGQVELQTFDPPPLQPHEVLIETTVSLISPGTERAFFLGLPNTTLPYPIFPGYSNVGRIVKCGTAVTTLAVGDRVASPAAHASQVVVTAERCVPIPVAVGDESAVFFNLIAIAMQGIHKARIELGESVAVIGAGLIGLFAVRLAQLAGGLPVISIDQKPERLALAAQLGADVTLISDESITSALASELQTDGATVVIEATGATAPVLMAFQLARPGGRVILLGSARGEADGVNFYRDVHRKGLTIIGAHEYTRPAHQSYPGWWTQLDEQHIALHLLAKGRIDVSPLITHRFAWEQLPQAYEMLRAWNSGAMGMVIRWQP